MVLYRRNWIRGGNYFFTITLKDRKKEFLTEYLEEFQAAYNAVKANKNFKTLAYVVLPDHFHVLWQLPVNDADYAGRWREIKKSFTKRLISKGIKLHKNKHGEYDLWQRRYWEHTIKDENDFENHINYIHYNPVKHGLAKQVKEWEYSSFHEYYRRGLIPLDWAGSAENVADHYGE